MLVLKYISLIILFKMIPKIKIEPVNKSILSTFISFIIHLIVLFLALVMLNEFSEKGRNTSPFIQISSRDIEKNVQSMNNNNHLNNDKMLNNAKKDQKKIKNISSSDNSIFTNFSKMTLDTTSLDQIYHEPSFNVTIKYPNGWTYIDQDVKNKLDGVTFWFANSNLLPPPYVHLEVEDKDLFDSQKYKYCTEVNGYKIFYNKPDILEDQISQTLYIRTNYEVDYSLKLIIIGQKAFESFQPIFFGMVNSFKFGKSFF